MGTFTQNGLMIGHEEVNIEMKRAAIISSGKFFYSTFE